MKLSKSFFTSANAGYLLCKVIIKDIEENTILSKVTIKTRREVGIEVCFVDPAVSRGWSEIASNHPSFMSFSRASVCRVSLAAHKLIGIKNERRPIHLYAEAP